MIIMTMSNPTSPTDGLGHWMVVWSSRDPLGGTVGFDPDILMTYSGDNGVTWSAPAAVNADAVSDPGGFLDDISSGVLAAHDYTPKIACDGQSHWIVTWARSDNRGGSWSSSIMTAVSADRGDSWSTPAVLQTRSNGNDLQKHVRLRT